MQALNDLSMREKIVLGGGAIIVLILLYMGLFLFPTVKKIQTSRKQLSILQKQWAEMKNDVDENRSLQITGEGVPTEQVSLVAFLEKSGNSLNISNKIAYLRPSTTVDKGEGAEVKLDNVTGEEIMRLLHGIQKARIKVVSINLRDHNLDGLWTVKIFLEESE